jgi:predicted Rossmann-fold nucleotide-binding protein
LIQTNKIGRFPIILMGTSYWSGLFDWVKNTMLAEGNINKEDLDLFKMTDDVDVAIAEIKAYYDKNSLHPNF